MVLENSILNTSPTHGAVFNLQSAPHTNVPIKKIDGFNTVLIRSLTVGICAEKCFPAVNFTFHQLALQFKLDVRSLFSYTMVTFLLTKPNQECIQH